MGRFPKHGRPSYLVARSHASCPLVSSSDFGYWARDISAVTWRGGLRPRMLFGSRGELLEAPQVVLRHAARRKPLLKHGSNTPAVKFMDSANCVDGLPFSFNDETGRTMIDDLGDRA